MSHLIKTAFLYLLMLAIPAQGYAASAMLSCSLAGQRSNTAQEADHHSGRNHPHTPAADHDGHVLPAVSADSFGPVSGDGGVDFTNSDNDLGNGGGPGKLSCSACAACCMGAAVTDSDRKPQLAGPAVERMASAPLRNIGFVTDGPRRPPRSFPA